MMTKLKVCLIGATGVGKTSLVGRLVHSIFSDTYRTTIGVQIEAYEVQRGDRKIQLIIWDLSGEDEFQSVQPAYISGSAGYLLVIDGTRRETVDTGHVLEARVRQTAGDVPFVVVINKTDLVASWEVQPADLEPLRQRASGVIETSARSGTGVREAFGQLVDAIFPRTFPQWI
jgi:small GTP-binding protein